MQMLVRLATREIEKVCARLTALVEDVAHEEPSERRVAKRRDEVACGGRRPFTAATVITPLPLLLLRSRGQRRIGLRGPTTRRLAEADKAQRNGREQREANDDPVRSVVRDDVPVQPLL